MKNVPRSIILVGNNIIGCLTDPVWHLVAATSYTLLYVYNTILHYYVNFSYEHSEGKTNYGCYIIRTREIMLYL